MKKKGRCFYQWLLLKTWPQYKRQEDVLSVSLIICPDGLFIVARVLLQELDILVGELLLDTADPHGRAAELWPNIWCAELATKVQDDFTIMDMEKTLLCPMCT